MKCFRAASAGTGSIVNSVVAVLSSVILGNVDTDGDGGGAFVNIAPGRSDSGVQLGRMRNTSVVVTDSVIADNIVHGKSVDE
jgi:hypothetical protein